MDDRATLDRLWEHSFETLRAAELVKRDDEMPELVRCRAQGVVDSMRVLLILLRENDYILDTYHTEYNAVARGSLNTVVEKLCPIDRSVMNFLFVDADRQRYKCTFEDEIGAGHHVWDLDWRHTWKGSE